MCAGCSRRGRSWNKREGVCVGAEAIQVTYDALRSGRLVIVIVFVSKPASHTLPPIPNETNPYLPPSTLQSRPAAEDQPAPLSPNRCVPLTPTG
jgi:hypothetical protein